MHVVVNLSHGTSGQHEYARDAALEEAAQVGASIGNENSGILNTNRTMQQTKAQIIQEIVSLLGKERIKKAGWTSTETFSKRLMQCRIGDLRVFRLFWSWEV